MINKYFKTTILASMLSFSPFIYAQEHIVIAPDCLIKKLPQIKPMAKHQSLSLIKVNDEEINQLIAAKKGHKSPCGGFEDVSSSWETYANKVNKLSFLKQQSQPTKQRALIRTHYEIRYEEKVKDLINKVNPQAMWNDLTTLTAFPDRFAGSDTGVKAAEWIKGQIESIAKNNGRDDVEAYFVKTGRFYKQPSLVVKIGKSTQPGVVVGGHMDTLSSVFSGDKPGADDDGTGTVTVIEVARTLLSSGYQFKKPIYLVWYAAEEMGLVGSKYVVSDFKEKNISVDAVMQLDMTGYAHKNDQTIWLITDYVNKDLTNYLEKLVNTYVKKPIDHTKCGYACSDHATWHQNGFAASIPFESSFGNDNPHIHSSNDKMEYLSLDHMTDYAKLAVAFAVELAEPLS